MIRFVHPHFIVSFCFVVDTVAKAALLLPVSQFSTSFLDIKLLIPLKVVKAIVMHILIHCVSWANSLVKFSLFPLNQIYL